MVFVYTAVGMGTRVVLVAESQVEAPAATTKDAILDAASWALLAATVINCVGGYGG